MNINIAKHLCHNSKSNIDNIINVNVNIHKDTERLEWTCPICSQEYIICSSNEELRRILYAKVIHDYEVKL